MYLYWLLRFTLSSMFFCRWCSGDHEVLFYDQLSLKKLFIASVMLDCNWNACSFIMNSTRVLMCGRTPSPMMHLSWWTHRCRRRYSCRNVVKTNRANGRKFRYDLLFSDGRTGWWRYIEILIAYTYSTWHGKYLFISGWVIMTKTELFDSISHCF